MAEEMKNFEQWWYESDFDEELLDPYYFAKNVWRKALEWAESQSCLDEYAIEKELGREVVK